MMLSRLGAMAWLSLKRRAKPRDWEASHGMMASTGKAAESTEEPSFHLVQIDEAIPPIEIHLFVINIYQSLSTAYEDNPTTIHSSLVCPLTVMEQSKPSDRVGSRGTRPKVSSPPQSPSQGWTSQTSPDTANLES